ncbi:hypothetical protein PGTUg99_032017 [Puccinia graminis f. sp. tritici]|uniref:Uncharacterized protein n=1 Tax=Puccinia graminis f. sp. tritici TaxID=56615 RepID=A0A5B0NHP3_PUCGR|nr:hypothetical protein PGTUg99_032017 [Puccinia graminis f. sp. tritici]
MPHPPWTMQPHARPTPKVGYSVTHTGSAEQSSVYLTGKSLWTSHPVLPFAKDATQDRLSFTPYSQYSWFDESKPELGKCTQSYRAAGQAEQNEEIIPSPYHDPLKRALSVTSYQSNIDSTSFLPSNPHIPSPTQSFFQNYTFADPQNQANHATYFSPEPLAPHVNCTLSSGGEIPTEETRRPERQRVQPGIMPLVSSMLKYPILEPTKIHTVNRSARRLEKNFRYGSVQPKMLLDQRESSQVESSEFSRVNLLVEQGQTLFMLAFGSMKYDCLPRLDELKQSLQAVETTILQGDFKLVNANQYSEIWTRLEAIHDQAISVGDSLIDFTKHLSRLQKWVCACLIPASIRFYSIIQDVNRNRASKRRDNNSGEEEPGSALMLLKEVVEDIDTAQLFISFYHSCMSSFLLTLDEFLHAIPEAGLSVDELVLWSRLSSSSMDDVSNGLVSFRDISEKFASSTVTTPNQPNSN